MNRDDYIALAAAFRSTYPYVAQHSTKLQRAQYTIWHETRGHVMQALASDNPNFDRSKFLVATELPID